MKMEENNLSDLYKDVELNEYGYYTLKHPPTEKECENFYTNLYARQHTQYTPQELDLINAKLEQKLILARYHNTGSTFLDIGCGKGFALAFFKKNEFSVLGLDYGRFGIEHYNPELLDSVLFGDLYKSIDSLIDSSKYFDIINLDCVLEHVINPRALVQKLSQLLAKDGIVIIKVPNDFSILQNYLFDNGIVSKFHWVAPMDHISYFNKDGLLNLCKTEGLTCVDFLTDYMIEFNALNPLTNYFEDRTVGRSCHMARVAQENFFHSISPQKTIELYRILGEMNLGREIIGVFKADTKPN